MDNFCLLFINKGSTNSVSSVPQVCQFLLVYAKHFWSLHIYVCLLPCCILLFVNWEPLVFLVFLWHITIFVLFWGMFYMIKIEKSLTLPIVRKGVPVPFLRHPTLEPVCPLFKIFVSPPPPFSVTPPFKVFQTVPLTLTLLPLTLIQYTNLP